MIEAHVSRVIVRAIRAAHPREISGLLVSEISGQRYVALPNWAGVLGEAFTPQELVAERIEDERRLGRTPLAILHSHYGSLDPSDEDLHAVQRLSLPMLIVAVGGNEELLIRRI